MLKLVDLCKKYTAGKTAVSYLNLSVADGEIVALLGGEGAGKTSLLKVISGTTDKSSGQILWDGKPLATKDVIMVFDDLALQPKQTVRKNLELSLSLRGISREQTEQRIGDAAEYLGLIPVLSEKVRDITPVEKRKTALARLILRDDFKLVLMDDILLGLDVADRRELWSLVMSILPNLTKSVIFATTEAEEAIALADRIVLLDNCNVKQIGTPQEIRNFPASVSAAKLLDRRYNVMRGTLVRADDLAVELGRSRARLSVENLSGLLASEEFVGKDVLVGFSYDGVVPFEQGAEADVVYAERLLQGRILHCQTADGEVQILDDCDEAVSSVVRFLPRVDRITLFDVLTENSILKQARR